MCTFSGCLVGQILKFWQPTLARSSNVAGAPPQTRAAGKLINRGTRSVDSHSVGVWTWMAEDVEPDDKKPPWTRLDGVHEKCTINNSLMIFIIWRCGRGCSNNQSSAVQFRECFYLFRKRSHKSVALLQSSATAVLLTIYGLFLAAWRYDYDVGWWRSVGDTNDLTWT